MKRYWETQVELVFTLKRNAASSSLAASMVKTKPAEGVFVVGVEGFFPSEPKEKVFASTSVSTSSPVFPRSIIPMLPRWQ